MIEPTQIAILELIHNHPGIKASDISSSLKLSRADVYYHLNTLLQQDQIRRINFLQEENSRGRPSKGYVFNDRSKFDNLLTLIHNIFKLRPELLTDENLQLLANQMSSSFIRSNQPRHLAVQVVQLLSNMNYHPSWEAARDGPRIIIKNCPYQDLVNDFPQLCRLDAFLLSSLFGQVKISTHTRVNSQPHSSRCVFEICGY